MKCPLLNKDCIENKCSWYAEFVLQKEGSAHQTSEKSCVVTRLPRILIEIIHKTNSVGAAIESQRNEFVASSNFSNNLLAGIARLRIKGNGEA